MTRIIVPALGESISEATVARWLKKEGDVVEIDEPVIELETDKVTLEVNSPEAGVISRIVVAEGDNVEVGALLGEIAEGTAANDSKPVAVKEEKKTEAKTGVYKEDVSLSPAVRKLVGEHDLDPSKIEGTGKDGRLLKEDVLRFIGETPAVEVVSTLPVEEVPKVLRQTGPREERVKMTRLRQSVAKHLKDSQNTAATLTTFNEVDMGAVMALRVEYKEAFEKKHGVKLGFMSFFVKAVVNALKELPAVNAEIDGDDIVYKNYYDIGVAVSTLQGLVVPVVRDCEEKSMADIEKDIMDVGTRAREGKLRLDELQGGTFTITNGGIFGSLMSTPILNTPQSGILGMHKIHQRPMAMPDGSIEVRSMMYLALSYDHRMIDGREAVTFLVRIKDAIEDPQRLLLDI